MKRDITSCARCGAGHRDLDVLPLANAVLPWNYYAICPTTEQPVLVTFTAATHTDVTQDTRAQLEARAMPPHTRRELAHVIDQVHELLHQVAGDVTEQRQVVFIERDEKRMERIEETLLRAHELLHSVGAGQVQAISSTRDPEAQSLMSELMQKLEGTGLPCGHRLADLIGGKDAVTRCGACLAAKQAAPAP